MVISDDLEGQNEASVELLVLGKVLTFPKQASHNDTTKLLSDF